MERKIEGVKGQNYEKYIDRKTARAQKKGQSKGTEMKARKAEMMVVEKITYNMTNVTKVTDPYKGIKPAYKRQKKRA
jgi:hypothetical protein